MKSTATSGTQSEQRTTIPTLVGIPSMIPIPDEHQNHNHGWKDEYNNNNKQNSDEQTLQKMHLSLVESSFYTVFGRTMSPMIQDQVCMLMGRGVEPAMICSVIEYTANAPRPSWQYASFVLRAKLLEGITTDEQWHASLLDWDRAHAPTRPIKPLRKGGVWHDWD